MCSLCEVCRWNYTYELSIEKKIFNITVGRVLKTKVNLLQNVCDQSTMEVRFLHYRRWCLLGFSTLSKFGLQKLVLEDGRFEGVKT